MKLSQMGDLSVGGGVSASGNLVGASLNVSGSITAGSFVISNIILE